MQTQIKVSSAHQAWQLAQDWIQRTYDNAKFVMYLKDATLVYFEGSRFVFEVPSDTIAGLLSRRSEKLAIEQSLEIYMPSGVKASVEFVVAGAVQDA